MFVRIARICRDFGACRDLQGRRLRHVNDEVCSVLSSSKPVNMSLMLAVYFTVCASAARQVYLYVARHVSGVRPMVSLKPMHDSR
jgi:hypothetical protein